MKKIIKIIFILAIINAFTSCKTAERWKYLQSKDSTSTFSAKPYQYRVQVGDNLYIKVISIDDKASDNFNSAKENQNILNSNYSIYLNDAIKCHALQVRFSGLK